MRLIDADKLLENIEKRIKGAKSLAEVVDYLDKQIKKVEG